MSDLGDLITVGLLSQKDGLSLTANEAHAIAEDIARHIFGKVRLGELDAAWAEAEALVPNGYRLDLTWPLTIFGGPPENLYHASCRKRSDYLGYIGHNPGGPTPAAALRALAAKLREVGR